jgi:hypothetical protein
MATSVPRQKANRTQPNAPCPIFSPMFNSSKLTSHSPSWDKFDIRRSKLRLSDGGSTSGNDIVYINSSENFPLSDPPFLLKKFQNFDETSTQKNYQQSEP